MTREGISGYVTKSNATDLLGERTFFRQICTGLVAMTVQKGKWFSFCTRISESQVDIMRIKNEKSIPFSSFLKEYYENSGYRTGIYKYLLHEFLCYYEVPTQVHDSSSSYGFKSSYEKFLATSNISVVASWLGISVEEAQSTYGCRLDEVDLDNETDLFQYVKLYETKEGVRKVSRPRKDLDLGKKGTRVIPLFALKAGVDVLYEKLLSTTYNVTFQKDNYTQRVINTTFDVSIIKKFYTDSYVNGAVSEWYEGDFLANPTLGRGYIRVFELGASIYDSPLRAINYARILRFEEAEPNMAFMNVDLDGVVATFKDYILSSKNLDIKELVDMLDAFEVGSERKISGIPLASLNDIDTWVDLQYTLLSTTFSRQLATFMLANPQWFEGYTGAKKVSTYTESSNFEFDGELDFE